MSLAGDVIIQGAPGLTATAAGVPIEMVTFKGGLLTIITGAVAIPLAYFMNRKEIKEFYEDDTKNIEDYLPVLANNEDEDVDPANEKYDKFGAIFLIVVVVGVIFSMFAFDIKGGDAAGLLGGAALFIIAVMTLLTFQLDGLDKISDFLGEGLPLHSKLWAQLFRLPGSFSWAARKQHRQYWEKMLPGTCLT
ncbi:MAG: hypothetical protein K9L56_13555 [Clostridiales bacterium]|nr:hypothetical protein [Clostridiales bacterium]